MSDVEYNIHSPLHSSQTSSFVLKVQALLLLIHQLFLCNLLSHVTAAKTRDVRRQLPNHWSSKAICCSR